MVTAASVSSPQRISRSLEVAPSLSVGRVNTSSTCVCLRSQVDGRQMGHKSLVKARLQITTCSNAWSAYLRLSQVSLNSLFVLRRPMVYTRCKNVLSVFCPFKPLHLYRMKHRSCTYISGIFVWVCNKNNGVFFNLKVCSDHVRVSCGIWCDLVTEIKVVLLTRLCFSTASW